MPCAKEEALAIDRPVMQRGPTLNVNAEAADIRAGLDAWVGAVRILARCLVMISVAAFAVLVLLPAAIAAQATVPV
jgi:hypothetical protein